MGRCSSLCSKKYALILKGNAQSDMLVFVQMFVVLVVNFITALILIWTGIV